MISKNYGYLPPISDCVAIDGTMQSQHSRETAAVSIPLGTNRRSPYMEQRSEDCPKRTMQEMVGLVFENMACCKQLPINSRILVNSRLAKLIGADEYDASRRLINDNVDEGKRRGILLSEGNHRSGSQGLPRSPWPITCHLCDELISGYPGVGPLSPRDEHCADLGDSD
jgi:hypothetical protein